MAESPKVRPLVLETLEKAVAGDGVAFRCRATLQPAAGEGTKVFPPTYAGAVYATEKRRLPDRADPVECVLLDSVQSQANRMEEALQQAIDGGRITLPVVEVDFTPFFPGGEVDPKLRLLDPVGKVGVLQAPHRIADAILRDSLLDGVVFRQSTVGKRLGLVSARDATALFELCPTALVFGMWDSTGPKGGLGVKFERAIVAEIVGIDAVYGVRTSSRIDPLGIKKNAGPIYRRADGSMTLDPADAIDELKDGKPTGKKILYKKDSKGKDVPHDPRQEKFADQGRPSEANHGNVTPSFGKYARGVEGRDPLGSQAQGEEREARENRIAAGGVTIARAEQTVVLSLPVLRRLRFPSGVKNEEAAKVTARDNAARTVLAALGLCAAALAAENGLDLRSRCLLWPTEPPTWELLRGAGIAETVSLDAAGAIALYDAAVKKAKALGLPWLEKAVTLQPSNDLVKLVVKSQELAVSQGDAGEGE